MIKIGEHAPHFELYSSEKEKWSITDFEGQRILLLFFPLAFTSVCSDEMEYVNDTLGFYKEMECEVIAISVDSLFVLHEFKKAKNLNFLLLSDFNREVSRSYQCIHDNFAYGMKGVSKRSAFILNSKGIVKHVEVLENPSNNVDFPKIKQILNKLGNKMIIDESNSN